MKMKFPKKEKYIEIPNGSYRNKMWFALFPVWIEGEQATEFRWLCTVRVKQRYYEALPAQPDKNYEFYREHQIGWWENVEFLEP